MGDHPRSRGVYRSQLLQRSHNQRIIPARAGFTSGALWGLPSCGDHPRSRGVYQAVAVRSASPTGSSPLARGLPIPLTAECGRGGIIPARAGFTPSSVGWSQRSGDHPRSRGVYRVVVLYLTPPRGSSPLARGLPGGRGQERVADRIIPARAGFTNPLDCRVWSWGDHPRSRGVYPQFSGVEPEIRGSSPLARGLPRCRPLPHSTTGIIPARAGFTPEDDHALPYGGGSSPLARGLRGLRGPSVGGLGIIPARAGFTKSRSRARRPCADHPRSRGVYLLPLQLAHEAEGSSPLARGLPKRPEFRAPICRDHPRSRGVYEIAAKVRLEDMGSSPLARGLPGDQGYRRRRPRIIPARAGFTDNRAKHHCE